MKNISSLLGVFLIQLAFPGTGFGAENPFTPYAYPQPDSAPSELLAIIEIPQGSINKYEIDPDSGLLILSRVLSMPVAYPANYGAFPRTLAGDGDALDLLVASRSPIQAGALVLVRPIGVLRMVDGGEQDDKILCVPAGKVDPTYDPIKTVEDLPKIERERIKSFFRVYKDLPEGRKKVELKGFGDVEEARNIIREALEVYKAKRPAGQSRLTPALEVENRLHCR